MKKQVVDFSDDPHEIRAFNVPLGPKEDTPLPEVEEMTEEERMRQLLDKLNTSGQPAEMPEPETDVSALEDRRAKFERFLAGVEGGDPETSREKDPTSDVYDQRDANRRNAMILKGMQQALGGVVNRYDERYKQDTSVADQLYKDADQPVDDQDRDIKLSRQKEMDEQRNEKFNAIMNEYQNKLAKSKLELDNMERTNDPASEESKLAQDFVMEAYPDKFNEETIREISGAQLFRYFEPLQQMTANHFRQRSLDQQDRNLDLQGKRIESQERLAEKKLEDAKTSRDRKDSKEERLMSRNLIQSASTLRKDDKRLDNAIKQSQGLDEVRELMKSVEGGNQAALAALGTKLARAMGEVGVLTDADVTRYVGSTSWGRKLKDWFTKGAQGSLPEETLAELQQNIGKMNNHLEKDMKKSLDYAYKRFEAAYPQVDQKRLAKVIGMPSALEESSDRDTDSESGPYGDEVERNGKTYKWNAAVGKYQLKE